MTHLPKAKIVFDHFHVIKLFNDKLSNLRRELYREAVDIMQKAVLKGTRWLLLKNPENLVAEKNEKRRLEEALALNKPLATAYYMKDDLRRFWNQPGKTFGTGRRSWMAGERAPGIARFSRWPRRWPRTERGCWRTTPPARPIPHRRLPLGRHVVETTDLGPRRYPSPAGTRPPRWPPSPPG